MQYVCMYVYAQSEGEEHSFYLTLIPSCRSAWFSCCRRIQSVAKLCVLVSSLTMYLCVCQLQLWQEIVKHFTCTTLDCTFSCSSCPLWLPCGKKCTELIPCEQGMSSSSSSCLKHTQMHMNNKWLLSWYVHTVYTKTDNNILIGTSQTIISYIHM